MKMASADIGARQLGPERSNEYQEEKLRGYLTRSLIALVFTRILRILDGERVKDISDTFPTERMTASRNAWLCESVHANGAFLSLSCGIGGLQSS